MRTFVKVVGILCVLAVGMVSCGGKHSDKGTIKLPYSSEDVISFVELVDTLCTIQLEDSSEALLSDATKIIEYNDKLFILDLAASKIMVFDELGKYLYSIGRKGNGAGEYAMLFDFTINTATGEVVMLAQGSVVSVYDEEGKFKEHKKVSDAFFLNITYAEGQYVFSANHSPYNEAGNAYLIHTFNQQFEETGKYIPSLAIQVPDAGLFGSHLKSTGRNAYYMDMFTQKLYEIGQDGSEQLFDFFFPNPLPQNFDPMEMAQHPTKYDWLFSFVPQNDHFIITYMADGHMNLAVINHSGKVLGSGLLAGVLLNMFPSGKGYIISPVSKVEYYMDWLGYSYDDLSPEVMDSNVMIFKWKCNDKVFKEEK